MKNVDAVPHIKVPEECLAACLVHSVVSSYKREVRVIYVYLVLHVSRYRVKDALGAMGFFFAPQRKAFLEVFVSMAFRYVDVGLVDK